MVRSSVPTVNAELTCQRVHADTVGAGCSHSVHFLVREPCSRSLRWFRCRLFPQRSVASTAKPPCETRFTRGLLSHYVPLAPVGTGIAHVIDHTDDEAVVALFVMTGYAVTESAGHAFYNLAMNGISRLATALSHDLAPHGVTALTLSPSFTSTEAIRAAFGDTPLPPGVDTVEHVGNTARALWNDPNIGALSGQTVTVAELAERYRLTPDGQETTP